VCCGPQPTLELFAITITAHLSSTTNSNNSHKDSVGQKELFLKAPLTSTSPIRM